MDFILIFFGLCFLATFGFVSSKTKSHKVGEHEVTFTVEERLPESVGDRVTSVIAIAGAAVMTCGLILPYLLWQAAKGPKTTMTRRHRSNSITVETDARPEHKRYVE